jgi:hypothetical protein
MPAVLSKPLPQAPIDAVMEIMNIIEDVKENIPTGPYVELCNLLKKVYNNTPQPSTTLYNTPAQPTTVYNRPPAQIIIDNAACLYFNVRKNKHNITHYTLRPNATIVSMVCDADDIKTVKKNSCLYNAILRASQSFSTVANEGVYKITLPTNYLIRTDRAFDITYRAVNNTHTIIVSIIKV